MVRPRVVSALAALGLVLGVVATTAAPGAADSPPKQSQTLHFTSEPPTDAVVYYRWGYVVTAESSSGLPVQLSVDPGTPACTVDSGPTVPYGNLAAVHAGTCTVFADQPGNDEYLPAERISMTFEISRQSTVLEPKVASKGLLGLTPTTFRANLLVLSWWGPQQAWLPDGGRLVTFSVGGKRVCSATTVYRNDPHEFFGTAFATCRAIIGLAAARKYSTYTADFAGDRDELPTTATGKLL
jgi:hypothetical protein